MRKPRACPGAFFAFVMPGLVPGIHVFAALQHNKTWMAGTSQDKSGHDGEIRTQNALNVMMVRVSWMPAMVCTFSVTKWPMSVSLST